MRLSVKQFSKIGGAGGQLPTNEIIGKIYYDKKRNKYCFDIKNSIYDKEKRCFKNRDVAVSYSSLYKNNIRKLTLAHENSL